MQVRLLQDIEIDSATGREWEALVAGNPSSGFMQSLRWSKFKKEQGLDNLHLGLYDQDSLIGGTISLYFQEQQWSWPFSGTGRAVLPWGNMSVAECGFKSLLEVAQRESTRYGAMAVRVEPRLAPPGPEVLLDFGRAPVDLVPRETLYLDLQQSPEQLLDTMKPKGRYNIRLSQRHGVVVHEQSTTAAIKRLYPVLLEASARDGFILEPMPFFMELAQALCPSRMARIFFAEHEGDTLGALLLITYGNRATYLYGGITNTKRNLMGGYALQWEAINAARESGCSTYDFYGFDQFGSPLNRYARFSQFKRLFGGTVMRFIGAQDHFFVENLADVIIKTLKEMEPSVVPAIQRTPLPVAAD